jgi:hypothetical protein
MKGITELALPFLLGVLSFVRLPLVGALGLDEILFLLIAPFYLNRVLSVLRLPAFRSMFLLGLGYFLSLIIADIYRDTPTEDFIRGWARVGITLSSFILLAPILFDKARAVPAFLIGWCLSSLGSVLIKGAQIDDMSYLYKMHIGASVSAAAFLAVGYSRGPLRRAARFLPLLAGGIAFLLNCRSLAGVTLLTHAVNTVAADRNFNVKDALRPAKTKARVALVIVLVCSAGLGIFQFYKYAVAQGFLGEGPRETYEMQIASSQSGQFTVLVGRWDQLYTWPKIMESPIIGHGSWAKDFDYVMSRAGELGMDPALVGVEEQKGLVPAHSHITGGWLEAGILGGIFWIIALWRAMRLVIREDTVLFRRLAPLMTFLLMRFAWDVLFSPYGGAGRLWSGFMLAWIAWTETQTHSAENGAIDAGK